MRPVERISAQSHGGQDLARHVLGLVEGLPLVLAHAAVNVGRGAAEVIPHVRSEGNGIYARGQLLAVHPDPERGLNCSRTWRLSASPESPLATAICSGVGPAEFRNSRRNAPRVARSRSIANWRDIADEEPDAVGVHFLAGAPCHVDRRMRHEELAHEAAAVCEPGREAPRGGQEKRASVLDLAPGRTNTRAVKCCSTLSALA